MIRCSQAVGHEVVISGAGLTLSLPSTPPARSVPPVMCRSSKLRKVELFRSCPQGTLHGTMHQRVYRCRTLYNLLYHRTDPRTSLSKKSYSSNSFLACADTV